MKARMSVLQACTHISPNYHPFPRLFLACKDSFTTYIVQSSQDSYTTVQTLYTFCPYTVNEKNTKKKDRRWERETWDII